MLTKETHNYEFLFRWNDQGQPQGAHIVYRESVREDGTEIASKVLNPQPVALDDADKLASIGAAINASMLADNAAKAAQIASLTEQLQAAVTANGELARALEQARKQASDLQAALDAKEPAAL